MLRNFEMEDHSATLFCLATLALMSSTQVAASTTEGETSPRSIEEPPNITEQKRNSAAARQYFVSKRASKTLDLVVLIAVFVCSKNCRLSEPKIIENLRLSSTIITAIEDAERRAWVQSDKGKVKKLVEKTVAYDGQAEVSRALLLDEASVQEQLLSLFKTADRRLEDSKSLNEIDTALTLVESFLAAAPKSTSLRKKVLYLLSTDCLREPLRHFLNMHKEESRKGADLGHSDICPYVFVERRALLSQKICTLLIKTAILSQHDDLSLDPDVASALLAKMTSLALKSITCDEFTDIRRPRIPPSLSVIEMSNTPCSSASSEQWKARVKNDLVRNADHQYQTIVRTMGDVCQDLERRCNEIERPLRDEQARASQLLSELEESQKARAELESRNEEQRLIMEGIEQEKKEVVLIVEELRREQEDLWSQIEGSRKEFHMALEQISVVTQKGASEVKELQLFHASAIAEKEDLLEAQLHAETALKTRIDDLELAAADFRSKASTTNVELLRLQETCSVQQTSLENAQSVVHGKNDEIDQQQRLLSSLEVEKVELQSRVESLSEKCQSIEVELEDKGATIKSQLTELHEMRFRHENELSARIQAYRDLRESTESRIEELQTLQSKEAEAATRRAEENETLIQDLENEISKARSELDEARGLHEQVMSFWSKQRPRHDKIERNPDVTRGNSVSDANRTQLRDPSTSATPHSASSNRKQNRRVQRRISTVRSKRIEMTPTGTESQGLGDRDKPVPQPLRSLDAGMQRGREQKSMVPSGGQRKKTTRWERHENDQDENVDTAMTEVSSYDTDFFASTDQDLEPPQSLPDDTTVEF
ncbi:MAG: hypothetical protein Q9220_006823 [cf. Caloplaca sp. 1 TL-2023]